MTPSNGKETIDGCCEWEGRPLPNWATCNHSCHKSTASQEKPIDKALSKVEKQIGGALRHLGDSQESSGWEKEFLFDFWGDLEKTRDFKDEVVEKYASMLEQLLSKAKEEAILQIKEATFTAGIQAGREEEKKCVHTSNKR